MKADLSAVAIALFVALALTAVPWIAAGQTPEALESISEAYETAYEDDGPVRVFVYLVLRVAGAAWIGVEWVAAITLVLGYRVLRNAFPKPGAGP